ncbi:hypothetical protein PENSPDRAFT_44799 [Peniophora sp. CONT]|nr:hypothetical protein PENSPDRAFT_44799 [Peniophora sp. CONT]
MAQVNLILGDFFKRNRELKEFLNQALAVVKWFNNHSVARGILGRWQTKVGLFTVLILILPCATRWTSYYNATKRLLKVEHAIRRAVRDDATRAELLACAGNKKEAKEQAAKVICTVEDDSFWDGLHLLLGVLKPMALASHATQTDHAHLGVVFGSLVRLYWSFSLPKLWKRQDMHEPIRNSIQKRFENTEYELLVLAILLNPYLRKAPFRDGSPFSSFAGCYELFERAYSRLVRERPNLECRAAFRSYILEEPGPWSAKNMGLDEAKRRAALEDKPINLVHLWREFDTKGDNGRNGLVRVALILHSAVANSAATERYFSALGTICSKLRTRLLPERMRKTVLVKRQVNADFPKQSKRQRRQTAGSWANTGDADMQGDEEFIAEPFIATSSSAASGEADFGQPSTQSGRSNAASFSQASPSPSLDASTVNALVGAGMLDRSAIDQFTAATGTSAGMFDEEALRLTQDALAAERLEAETAEFMSTAVHEHPMRYSVQDFALPNLLDLSGYPDKPCHGLKLLLEFFDSGKGSLDGERDFLESVTQSVTT